MFSRDTGKDTVITNNKADKQELSHQHERTMAGKFYTPNADIFETKEALMLVLDMPGVARDQVDVRLENDILEIEGKIGIDKPNGFEPVYSEYNVGNYYRRFSLSNKVAKDQIEARMADGVLTLTLPKAAAATPRKIAIS